MQYSVAFLLSVALVAADGRSIPGGCGHALPVNVTLGKQHLHRLPLVDPDTRLTEVIHRQYRLYVPSSYKNNVPMPILLYYHGQCDDPSCSSCIFTQVAEEHGFILVLPVGLNDGTGCVNWDVGSSGRTDVCTSQCDGTTSKSCKIIGNSSNCNWSTCYDDFHFAEVLMAQIRDDFCIDEKQIFLSGSSNGGMFGYLLASRLPIFAGYVPWYGAFLKNMAQPPPPLTLHRTTITAMHGGRDVTLPMKGGESYDHYLYQSMNDTLDMWRKVEDCGTEQEVRYKQKQVKLAFYTQCLIVLYKREFSASFPLTLS
jgi:poly(3-hydroxybutyrate) depolymerase